MGRFSPYVPDLPNRNYGSEIADAIGTYIGGKRQEKLDTRADEEYAYTKKRHETLDPLEAALLQAQLYEHGIVPSGGGGSGTPPSGSGTLSSGIDSQRQAPMTGRGGLAGRAPTGVFAPGSFNPVTGTFNPAIPQADVVGGDPGFSAPRNLGRMGPTDTDPGFTAPHRGDARDTDPGFSPGRPSGSGRVSLGGGYDLDPSMTERGRADAKRDRMIAAMVARGVPREEAQVEVEGGLEGAISEHFHPGTWHPRTMADALDYEKTLIHARGDESVRVASVRDRRSRKDTDPRWEERRRGWIKRLGGNEPTNQLQQDIVDALADGDEPDAVLEQIPKGQRPEAERYLGRAVRQRGRETRPPLGSEPNK
jgi:hypothetical protein